ncbi:hypothetical protein [Falsibacillus albus]|uniref:Uncharacterized protein n=1 Tax=Falsibacillus albus TaxID=2478915 RepID=A0A3L7JGX0_9BACI|nr:hypothetical protein [Falsibacillus albus]RLQ89956.1 hypothetical protein D9X91_22180 [Falsibacillus albus]
MKSTQTIQISIYKAFGKSRYNNYEYNHLLDEFEFVYEAEVSSVADFIALTYRLNKFVKYKKPTDKNWYTSRTMVKRLFKKEIVNNKPIIKIAEVNCWEEKQREERLKKEEARKRMEERESSEIRRFLNDDIRYSDNLTGFGEWN